MQGQENNLSYELLWRYSRRKEVIKNVFNNEKRVPKLVFFSKLTNGTFSMLQARSDFCKIRLYFPNTPLLVFLRNKQSLKFEDTKCTNFHLFERKLFFCPCIRRELVWEAEGQSDVGHEFVSSFMVHSVSMSVFTSIGPSGRRLIRTSVATRLFTRSIPSHG